MPTFEIKYAPYAFQLLNGCFCVYKPQIWGFDRLRKVILNKLATGKSDCKLMELKLLMFCILDLNQLDVRPPKEKVFIEGSVSDSQLTIETKPSYCDHPLVVGPRYQPQDFSFSLVNHPGYFATGLVIGTIGRKAFLARNIRNAGYLRVYEVKGKLGLMTDNFMETGKIIEKSTFKHVTLFKMNKILTKFQSYQQSIMYRTMGIDIKSDAGYKLASQGLVRPGLGKLHPIVYGLKCIHFEPPDFTLEVQCIDEFQEFLAGIVPELALKLKTSAFCAGIRLVRYGPFTVENALLEKHWTLENMINNIKLHDHLIERGKIQPSTQILSNDNEDDNDTNQESFLEMLKRKQRSHTNKMI